jgi:cell shape-determining protein MreD
MGDVSINWLHTAILILAAYILVFLETSLVSVRNLLGVQIHFLPALIVSASLSSSVVTVALLALFGGLWFDALSANPLGVSVLPLFLVGFVIFHKRTLLLRDQLYAHWVLGIIASATAPALTVVLLLSIGETPLLGWGSAWPWVLVSLAGGIMAPVFSLFFGRVQRALSYEPLAQSSFRPDREIKRGRH